MKQIKLTYGDIYHEFLSSTKISQNKIVDYRPCCDFFGVPNIPNAIVVWLKGGDKMIYIKEN